MTFFLHLFASKNAPLFNAYILDDHSHSMNALLRRYCALLGMVLLSACGLHHLRLKLKPNGPGALRTPSEPYGRAPLTPGQKQYWHEVPEKIHHRRRQLLLIAVNKGALVGWDTTICNGFTPQGKHGDAQRLASPLLPCCSLPMGDQLAQTLVVVFQFNRWHLAVHPSFGGVKTSLGTWLSSETAEYRETLAMALAKIITTRCYQALGWL